MRPTLATAAASLCVALLLLGGQPQGPTGCLAEIREAWSYVKVREHAYMFWWLMFADTPEYQAAPLIIWLQGGPGASSTGFGNFAEIGPQDVRLLPRNHSWVRFANLLFVDNPVGSGYSFVTNETGFAVNNSQIASDLVAMISVFLAKMPEFQNVPLYIFSESYGGKMAAEFALQLYKAHASGKVSCKLSGVALGDGWLSPLDSTSTWGQYLYTMSFLDKTNLMTLNKVVSEIRQALVAKDGAEATALWASAEDIVEQLTNGIDWYNILQPQQESSASLGVLSLPSDNTLGRAFVRHVAHFYNVFNGTLTELMNGPIKEKLGSIPKNVTWGGQSGAVFQALKADFMLPAVDTVDRLLNETDVTVAVYSGQLDLIVDALGTLQWMEQLKWPGMKEFQATSKKPMVVEGETAGYYKSFKNLTLYWVLKAGHMVPADAPLAAQSMARHITTGKW
ncbi:retinoid-inducible serine carboxypeptidase [Rhipicephalus sanguineus]|uniref:retinoid-inducible serine carboxypeptidase n=1 Tax=Rhipicephalus sanguineus TaxID=34632 RepID=UPI0018931F18|nr:retinoid-inducible serine carboxypeptidase [Rhipicephalus sanguineus]